MQVMKAAMLAVLAGAAALFGQGGTVVAGIGYSSPSPIAVAPGQIVTIFVRSRQTLAGPIRSTGTPAPRALGPFSVTLAQTIEPRTLVVPLLSAAPVSSCGYPAPLTCVAMTALTIQVPFELLPNAPSSRLPENFASFSVSEDGVLSEPIAVHPVSDRIHIVNSCDGTQTQAAGLCAADIRHADGTAVTPEKPAAAGETLTVFAYGLGRGVSAVPTGDAAPTPPVGVPDVTADLRYDASTPPAANSVTAEFVPGAVGLYRTSVQVPAVAAGAKACSATSGNLTLTLRRGQSADSAEFCVSIPPPPPGDVNTVPPRGAGKGR